MTEVDNDTNSHEISSERRSLKGPQRYQKGCSASGVNDDSKLKSDPDPSLSSGQNWLVDEGAQFVEERYGRNLDLSYAAESKRAIRRRIAGALATRNGPNQFAEDIDSAMSAKELLGVSERDILEKWGPGCQFYGNGSANDLDDLERRCVDGERFLALFCEFPGNPLLHTPDLRRIRGLGNRFNFAVVVDETIGNFLNVHVLPDADVVVSSLTKVFSGDSNVMGGSLILNPSSRLYDKLKSTMESEYEDNYWAEDALFMERNSRDFVSRIARINTNAEAICDVLKASDLGQLECLQM
ncbi:MAG: hypothetical protein Q9174_000494 [Haloplaca sp. 1 TL-2023]